MEGYFVLIMSLGMVLIVCLFFFGEFLKKCPKCGRIMQNDVIEEEKVFICRQCGHVIYKNKPSR
jgi:DNA-directed RNA polymerase subunit RPC12/RpoP